MARAGSAEIAIQTPLSPRSLRQFLEFRPHVVLRGCIQCSSLHNPGNGRPEEPLLGRVMALKSQQRRRAVQVWPGRPEHTMKIFVFFGPNITSVFLNSHMYIAQLICKLTLHLNRTHKWIPSTFSIVLQGKESCSEDGQIKNSIKEFKCIQNNLNIKFLKY